jgi:hypothetical protein
MPFPFILAAALAGATPQPSAEPTPTPQKVLALIRATFRTHRPPPPFVQYTLTRTQKTEQGYPDYVESYTYHIWERNSDRAAMGRRVYRGAYRGDPEFQRPAFNSDRDPGPPTADVFEPAPVHPQPIEFVPTPEPAATPLRVIGSVSTVGEFDYHVVSLDYQRDMVHLILEPVRDPERNRIREIWADAKTYEMRKLIATDKLFVEHGPVYGVMFTLTMGNLDGIPVVTDIHGTVGDGYVGDGQIVDYAFRDITFPKDLPDWYFNARQFAQHTPQLPI